VKISGVSQKMTERLQNAIVAGMEMRVRRRGL
jgi:hypothetical protein